jgi:phosphate transport system substrate-binding protein
MDNPRGSAWWQLFKRPALIFGALALTLTLALAACSDDDDEEESGDTSATPKLSGSINGDGSSTVFPILEAVAEEFKKQNPDVDITVGISGTGGGFAKFCNGETDFSNASRAIKDDETEAGLCEANGITYVEFQVGYDGITVVVNAANDFAECLTVEQLNTVWMPESTVDNWNQVDPSFPDASLGAEDLFGPGTDSGTFDYFTQQINGEEGASRSNYTASEDDNVLVQGVAGDDNALGYFGYAYYAENQDDLIALGVDDGNGCVAPSPETILDGSYSPLSRPLYVYVATTALSKPEVGAMVRYMLTEGRGLVEEVGYVQSPEEVYAEGLANIP